MISATNISARYGSRTVFDQVSLSVSKGEWVGVIGPNGAGKSTLLKALAGLLPVEGDIQVSGNDLRTLSRRMRAQSIAYVPQVPHLPDGVTVGEYVLLGRTPYVNILGAGTKRDAQIARDALDLLDARNLSDRDVATLSGGEAQRVVLARAIAQEPEILLLDEPTSALDLGRQQEAMQIIDELRTRHALTVVATMHDLMLAGQFTDRLLLINGGGILAEGTPREVLTSTTISQHYGADVRILEDPEGGVIVVPRRAAPASASTSEAL